MNEEILKLAKECDLHIHKSQLPNLETFYRAAYNKAIEDAGKVADECGEHNCACFHNIRTLEMK